VLRRPELSRLLRWFKSYAISRVSVRDGRIEALRGGDIDPDCFVLPMRFRSRHVRKGLGRVGGDLQGRVQVVDGSPVNSCGNRRSRGYPERRRCGVAAPGGIAVVKRLIQGAVGYGARETPVVQQPGIVRLELQRLIQVLQGPVVIALVCRASARSANSLARTGVRFSRICSSASDTA